MKIKGSLLIALALLAGAANVMAFPWWIGVYGSDVRHADTSNPGTFTVLMNQDYVGLHAEVGIQVDNGAWQVVPMTYAGNQDGNSKWTHTPAAAYPAGATVRYYFHGFDDWAGNLWDSNFGANYSFVVPGSVAGGLQFNPAQSFGTPGISGGMDDACVFGNQTYALASGAINRGTISGGNVSWNGWTSQALQFATQIAANDNAIITAGINDTIIWINRSTDGGATFSSTTISPNGQKITGVDVVGRGSEFVLVCITSASGAPWDAHDLLSFKSTDGGATWVGPGRVDSQAVGGFDSVEIGANASNYFVLIGFTEQAYASGVRGSVSANGSNWTTSSLFGNKSPGGGTMTVTPDGAYVALDPYYSDRVNVARWLNGTWNTGLSAPHALESGRSIKLAARNGEVYLFRAQASGSTGWDISRSTNGGANWTAAGSVTPPSGASGFTPYLQQVISRDGKIHLAWANDNWRYNSNYWQISQDGSASVGLQWIGNTYAYPNNGRLTPQDDLWINTETWQIAPGQSVTLYYRTYANGVFVPKAMDWWYNDQNNSHWHVNLGKLPGGMIVEYFVVATEGSTTLTDNRDGVNYSITVNAPSLVWAGNSYCWPPSGQVTSQTDFWVNIESWPKGAATFARLVFTTDGGATWFESNMDFGGAVGNNDWWHVNLGKFNSRTTIRYAIEIRDGNGKSIWDNNNGVDYRATVK